MFVPTSKIISGHKIIPAFGFSTAEMAKAIVETCENENFPAILQTSEKDVKFLSPEIASSTAWALGQKTKIDVALQLDHATDIELIQTCIKLGYGSVMLGFDELNFDENVKKVLEVKEAIKSNMPCWSCPSICDSRQEIIFEGGLSQFDRAQEFIEKTDIDVLAPIINNKIDLDSLEKIINEISTPVALHGCTGQSDNEIRRAVQLGVKKFNWSTCLRKAWVEGLRKSLSDKTKLEELRPSTLLERSVKNVKEVVEAKIKIIKKQ